MGLKSTVDQPVGEVVVESSSGLDAIAQLQLGAQINVNSQEGAAIATAVSDEVTVTSENDPAGGDGIKAVSEAEANAAVVQNLGTKTEDGIEPGQTNVNTAAATFGGSQVTIPGSAGQEEIPTDAQVVSSRATALMSRFRAN